MNKLTKLREAAAKADAERCGASWDPYIFEAARGTGGPMSRLGADDPLRAFIALCDPATIKRLLDVVEAIRADMKAGRYFCECEWNDDAHGWVSRCNFHVALAALDESEKERTAP